MVEFVLITDIMGKILLGERFVSVIANSFTEVKFHIFGHFFKKKTELHFSMRLNVTGTLLWNNIY